MLGYVLMGAGIVLGLIVLFLVVVALRSSDFRMSRSILINAPPSKAFEFVNTIRNWELWSPWQHIDPNMKQVYNEIPSGPGASQSWNGNNQVGEGTMTVKSVETDRLIDMKLEFLRPMKANNDVTLTFDPEGGATKVTWAMAGKHDFMGKAFDLVMNLDKMVGKDFEKGLAKLKEVVEKS
jgi:hypothetical protein